MQPCPTCPRQYLPIDGDGPCPARVLFIAERPGKQENLRHRVLCGPTGEEYNETYLRRAGLYRDEVYSTNCTLCWADGNRAPSRKEAISCASHHLPSLLRQVQPEVIVLMGGSACHLLDTPRRLDMYHGRPIHGSILGGLWTGDIWLSYHPSLGLHKGSSMTALLEDFTNLGQWLKGKWSPPVLAEIGTDYHMLRSVSELRNYLLDARRHEYPACGVDTESHGRSRWSTQLSFVPGTGVMWRVDRPEITDEFREFVHERPEVTWIFHNAAHDLDELDRDGIQFLRWRDTMQEAYHLCSLPQGLKTLAFRLLGKTMRSWEDVVLPASIEALAGWLAEAILLADKSLATTTTEEAKRGWCNECGHGAHRKKACGKKDADGRECGCPATDNVRTVKTIYHASGVEAVCTHILSSMLENPDYNESDGRAWGALRRMRVEGIRGKIPQPWEWDVVEEAIGPPPILGIGNCDEREATVYGCGDADHTLQVAGKLAEMRGENRFQVSEGDMDKCR